MRLTGHQNPRGEKNEMGKGCSFTFAVSEIVDF